MNQVLTKSQIEELFTFVRSKNVEYKDVQFEIVDHLASAIEDEMTQNPNLTFHSAMQKVYGRFPITGFAAMILEKEKSLRIYWRKSIWVSTLKMIFSLKGVPFLLAIGAAYLTLTYWGNVGTIILLLICVVASLYTKYYVDTVVFHIQDKKEAYLWVKVLFEQSIGASLIFSIWGAQFISSMEEWNQAMRPIDFWMFLVVVSLWMLGIFQIVAILPNLIDKELDSKYQHLGLRIVK